MEKSSADGFTFAVTNPAKTWPRSINPLIRGWISYYSVFYRTQLCPTLKRIDLYVIGCAPQIRAAWTKGARDWFARSAGPSRSSLPIDRYAMERAGHRELCDWRGSCAVLGASGGETLSGARQSPIGYALGLAS